MIAGVVALLCVLFFQLAMSVRANSLTWDEDDHIYAGYMSLKNRDYGLNPEHPPLVKMLAAMPLLKLPVKLPALQGRLFKVEAFLNGKDFIFRNNAEQLIDRARISVSLLTLLLALLVFVAAREMFGTGAAFIALSLLVFDPNIIAHGAVVGTDIGLSCFMFAAIYAFYRYVKSPTKLRLLLTALATGLALASKHTGILVFPMLLEVGICELILANRSKEQTGTRGKRTLQMAIALGVIVVISVGILWSFYGFRYAARPDGLQLNPSFTDYVGQLSRPREAWLISTVSHTKLLPESYLYGLTDVRIMSDFYTSYFFGKVYPHGIWYYFPVAFTIKSSLTFLVLFLLSLWAIATKRFTGAREILFLTFPPLLHLLVSMSAGMNIGIRHILPMYPFLFVLIGGVAWKFIEHKRYWAIVVAGLLIFQAVETIRIFPAHMAYANLFWGGPTQTHRYLTDSSVDWAQQLKSTKKFLDRHVIRDCWFAYFAQGVVDFQDYGIPCKVLPTADTLWTGELPDTPSSVSGTILISAGDLSGLEFGDGPLNPYLQFQSIKPVAMIDYGVMVYQGHFEIPLAAALVHAQRADNLLNEKKLPEALAEAQQAATLAPDAVRPNAVLGDVLTAMQKPQEARPYYKKALTLAKTVRPELQVNWVSTLEGKLAAK